MLVGAQFAISDRMVIAAGVVYEQRIYATHAALRVNADQILVIKDPMWPGAEDRLRTFPGCSACVLRSVVADRGGVWQLRASGWSTLPLIFTRLSRGFSLVGVEPVAGQIPRSPGRQRVSSSTKPRSPTGFSSAAAALTIPPVTNGTPIQRRRSPPSPGFRHPTRSIEAVRPSCTAVRGGQRVANMAGNRS